MEYPEHLAAMLADGTPEDEVLFHLVTEALEGRGRELEALEAVVELAQRANPHLTVTVTVGLAAVPLATGSALIN